MQIIFHKKITGNHSRRSPPLHRHSISITIFVPLPSPPLHRHHHHHHHHHQRRHVEITVITPHYQPPIRLNPNLLATGRPPRQHPPPHTPAASPPLTQSEREPISQTTTTIPNPAGAISQITCHISSISWQTLKNTLMGSLPQALERC